MLGLEMIDLIASQECELGVHQNELQGFPVVLGYLVKKDSCLVWLPDVANLPFG